MSYLKLSIVIEPEHADALSESLMELGALSVSLQGAEDEPIFQVEPGESPLWQQTKLDALFETNTNIETIIKALQSENTNLLELDFNAEKIEDQDWVRITQQHFQPRLYGDDLWVCPAWEETDILSGNIVKIDPGLAFGTGTHPTTSLCLSWLAENPPKDKQVIDYGCGSGILSLAALALGAAEVLAIDHDQQALIATENNAKLNDFYSPEKLSILNSDAEIHFQADLIVANILANPLIELAPRIISLLKPKSTLVLSGILDNEVERVAEVYEKRLTRVDTSIEDSWARVVFTN